MFRNSIRRFRTLAATLPTGIAANASANKEHQLQLINELNEVETIVDAGGSDKAKKLHKSRDKFYVRERIDAIKDPGSEVLEIGMLAGYDLDYGTVPRATLMTCIAKVHGIPVCFGGSDATVKGGTSYPITVKKSLRMSEIAEQNWLPSINLIDSGGAFLPLQSEIFPDKLHGGRNFYGIADSTSKGIPAIAVVCGSCTAGGAYTPSMCDEMVFVDKMGTMFLGGPPLVQAATGEVVTAEELGGAMLHCSESGGADYFAKDEHESSAYVRSIFETLNIPQHATTKIESINPAAQFDLLDVAGTAADVRLTLSTILDGSKFHEFKELFGTGLVCGYGRIDGHLVALVANNGNLDASSALKGAHFVHLANEREVPIVFLQNSQFHDDYVDEEMTKEKIEIDSFTLRARASLIAAVSVAKTPKVTICCAGSSRRSDLCPAQYSPNFIFRWPGSKALRTGFDFDDKAIASSARMWDDATVDPRNTRHLLSQCLEIFEFGAHHRRHIQSKNLDNFQPMYRL